jgi:peptidoglycan hydrolase CwlO-like protein
VTILRALRQLKFTQWVIIFSCMMMAVFVGVVMYVVQNSVDERDQSFRTLQIQSQNMVDQRMAQTRRIDLLNEEIEKLSNQIANQAETIGEQQLQIKALAEQVRRLGATPITEAPKP